MFVHIGFLILSFQTFEYWPYFYKLWNSDLILQNVGSLTINFQTLKFWPYPHKHWNCGLILPSIEILALLL